MSREDGLDGVGVDSLDDGEGSGLGSVLDGDHLVTDGSKDGTQDGDQVRLNTGGHGGLGSNGPDGLESPLTDDSILLVGELLLESLDSPRRSENSG